MQWNQHPAETDCREESSHDEDLSKNRPSLVPGFLRILPGNSPRPSPLSDFLTSEGYEFAPNRDLGKASDDVDGYLSQFLDSFQTSFFADLNTLIHCRADRRNL